MITLHGDHGSLYSEIIMSHPPIQSQTANFSKVQSQTTSRLYQHPTQQEQTTSSRWFSNFCMTMVLVIISSAMTVMSLRSCANDADFQAEKYRELNTRGAK